MRDEGADAAGGPVLRRAPGTPALVRLRQLTRRHPLAVDLLLAALVAAGCVLGDTLDPDRAAVSWLFDLALVLPLVARRRWPTPVFLAICAVALAQWAAAVQVRGDVAVLLGLYAVGAYESRRRLVGVAAACAQVGVLLATARWAPPTHVIASSVLLTGTVTAAWVIGSYVRTRRAYLAAVLERAATAERERDHQSQIAVAAERSRIAREMHDVVAHSLSVMIALNDGAAATALTDPAETRETVQQASAVGRQSLDEMRRLLGVLRADEGIQLAPQPADAQLDDLVDRIRSAGLPVELIVSGPPARSSPGTQLAVHRIVQESLTNVLKHAPDAVHTVVRLAYAPDRVDVEVTNDDPSPQPASAGLPGHGLVGMRERAALFGGRVQAGRGSDGSWRVSTRLRIRDDVDAP